MGITSLLFIGIFGILIVIAFRTRIVPINQYNFKWVKRISNSKWFKNHWYSGFFLFMINAIFFFLIIFLLYLLALYQIPYVHLIVMAAAVIISISLWSILGQSWEGTIVDRLKMAITGSSFYLITSVFYIYRLLTLTPTYPGEDTFMVSMGIIMGISVNIVAFITCFIFTTIPILQRR